MTLQITVLGLGQVGCSIGLALANVKDPPRRVGFDRSPETARRAAALKPFDALPYNIPDAVDKADVVILAMQVDEIRRAFEIMAPALKSSAVVIDTSPVKVEVMGWAKELFPDRPFLGMTPTLNPAYLDDTATGPEASHADLFKDGLMVITHPTGIDERALQLASDLAVMLGAAPLYADPWEVDGLLAADHLLPQLVAAAMVNAVSGQPGWKEGRKLADRAFSAATAPLLDLDEHKILGQAALLNRQNAVRVLDNLALELDTLRRALQNGDQETLTQWIGSARQSRSEWLKLRRAANWSEIQSQPTLPTPGEMMGQIIGVRKKKDQT
jgi:prephenate dehydrogenase